MYFCKNTQACQSFGIPVTVTPVKMNVCCMVIEKLQGTSPRLYTLIAPLVMRRSVLRLNNNYPFWTSRSHTWFVAEEGESVLGFVPVEVRDNGVVKINNYYVSGDDNRLLSRLIQEIVNDYRGDYTIQSVTHTRHIPVFLSEKFQTVKEWKLYVKMQYGEKPCGESANG